MTWPTCRHPGQTAEYTYTVPGVYIPGLKVTDNHGNTSWTFQMITVDPAYAKVRPLTNDDEDRAQRRRMLTNACGAGTGEACFELGKMVEEDGDTFTAQKLFERACSLGYDAACQIAKWMKW